MNTTMPPPFASSQRDPPHPMKPKPAKTTEPAMRDEYDFSQGVRGKFYRKDATLNLPIYLDDEVREYLTERARSKGVQLSELVNDMLRKDISLVESVK